MMKFSTVKKWWKHHRFKHDYDDEVDGNGNDFEEVDDKDVNEKVCDRK